MARGKGMGNKGMNKIRVPRDQGSGYPSQADCDNLFSRGWVQNFWRVLLISGFIGFLIFFLIKNFFPWFMHVHIVLFFLRTSV